MITTLITVPYKIVRTPLTLLDGQLAERLPETSFPRVALDRVIGTSDRLAGALLRDDTIAERGEERVERAATAAKVTKLEHAADAHRDQAQEKLATGRKEAEKKRKAAQERAEESLEEAAAAEERGKKEAAAKARKTAATKKTAADRKAASRKETIQQRAQRAEASAEAKKKAAQRTAKKELDDAREADQAAAESRADAERLSDLTDAKKQERRQD